VTALELLNGATVLTLEDTWAGLPVPLEELGHKKPPALTLTMLPLKLRAWAAELSARMAVPLEALTIPALIACSTVLGRRYAIQPYSQDSTWTETLNLWGVLVAEPGVILKTPSMNAAFGPLYALEKQLFETYKTDLSDFETHLERWKGGEVGQRGPMPERPTQKSIMADDITVEALATCLEGNPYGVLIAKDEILNLVKAWEQPAKAADRTFYMKGWGGQTPHMVRRQTRTSQLIPAVCISMYGTIQPGPLAAYIHAAASGGEGADGLLERFQLMTAPEPVAWVGVPEGEPNGAALEEYAALIPALWALEPAQIGALEPTEDGKPHRLIFDTEAQQRFTLWRDDLERRVRDTDLSSIMKSVLAKQRGLIPRLAALIHLSSGGVNPVQLPALTLAMAWGQFLEAHARYLFSSVRDSDSKAARVLAEHITAEKLGQTFKRRDLQLKTWAGLDSPKTIDGALSRLMEAHWIRLTADTKAYEVHPRVLKGVK